VSKKRVTDLRKRLDDLVSQRDVLVKRIADLERQLDDVQVGDDATKTVADLREVSAELDAARRVVAPLEARIAQVRADLQDAQSEEERVQVSRLWKAEQQKCERVVGLVNDLQTALHDLDATRRQIQDLGGFPQATIPVMLRQAVQTTRDFWQLWGSWHTDGGSLRQSYTEQKERWERGEVDPPNPAFVELMRDREARAAHEKRYGVKVRGQGDSLRVESQSVTVGGT